ncbi:hypothetical protein [Sedimenticola selenatireducens]|uniref:Uncharacterized protein n=1 Tax=Sedimenticola selenatireducens TaxID=191960 RepID=A0A557S875_9GAMM|nr:hypothetical protein [Sedimenticola selenatireducens]TVO73521.1 hypothetical protein FHP88_11630 [Sedimenticola selenatireducens]TVT63462.1 MAG: hypothetical protein FHK78_11560 [Sedimenticola selenatireducens]
MEKSTRYTLTAVFIVTSLVWAMGVSNHLFLVREIGLYLVLFFVPALGVCCSAWLIVQRVLWRRVVGLILLLPSVAVWALSLLLVYNGFKIH